MMLSSRNAAKDAQAERTLVAYHTRGDVRCAVVTTKPTLSSMSVEGLDGAEFLTTNRAIGAPVFAAVYSAWCWII